MNKFWSEAISMKQLRKKKKWKTNAIFLIALWIILLLASLTILSSVVTPFLKTLQTQDLVSFDWAGFSVASDALLQQPVVDAVKGSWIVPNVSDLGADTFSAAWVGIGGESEATLIQVGSEHDFVRRKAVYGVWYEMLPADSITIPNINVSPGDRISASIVLVNSDTNEWQIEIEDVTSGQRFSQIFSYNSSRLTAEWIVERPTVNNHLTNLANFGSITFNEITTQIQGVTGSLQSFPAHKILMQDRQNNPLVTVSDFSKNGSSFTVAYG